MSARSITVGPSPLASRPDDSRLADALGHLIAGAAQTLGGQAGRAPLLHRELGMRMDVAVERPRGRARCPRARRGCGPPTFDRSRSSPAVASARPGVPDRVAKMPVCLAMGDLPGFDPTLILWLNLVGTFVFGLSGGLAGVRARLDVFGVVVLSAVVGLAGGIIRDLLIGVPPATFRDWRYLAAAGAAGLVAFFGGPLLERVRSRHPDLRRDGPRAVLRHRCQQGVRLRPRGRVRPSSSARSPASAAACSAT